MEPLGRMAPLWTQAPNLPFPAFLALLSEHFLATDNRI